MNFFFGIKSNEIKCNITIPKFDNYLTKTNNNIEIFMATPNKTHWSIKKLECNSNSSFFFIDDDQINNNSIFFLATDLEVDKLKTNDIPFLQKLNSFTDTQPSAFRANLRIFIQNAGSSSYQSEYPFSMIKKNGDILSPISILLNKEADKNLIFFKNIYYLPIHQDFKGYLIDVKKNKIVKEFLLKTNFTNKIEIDKEFLLDDIFFFSEKILGIPLYVSIKNNHLSFEHTHPLHHYLLGENKFQIISNLKDNIKKIIYND